MAPSATDLKKRDADINRKLQIYGIVTAFQNGKLPSDDQIDVALNSFLESRALSKPSDRLSPDGRQLVDDVRDAVKQSKHLLLSKNKGNLLQDFIWQTRHFDFKGVNVPGRPVDSEAAKQHADQTLQGLRTLGTLLITNGQFRKLLNDATILLRDIAGDAATSAASRSRPSEEQLAQIDRPAEDNTWHDAPEFSKWKNQAQGVFKKKKDGSKDGSKDATETTPDGQETSAKTEEAKEKARKKREEYQARLKEYFSKKMPEERRQQTVWRIKKMVVECQQHPDYQQAISALLDLAEQYGDHANRMTKGGSGTVKEARTGLAAAESDLKTLIERFANGTSTQDLWDSINTIYEDADKDAELRGWFKSINQYIRHCLQEQGYIMEEESSQEWRRLYDHGNYLLREKYRQHTNRIIDEVKFVGGQFDKDPQNKAFGDSLNRLFTHLGNDENGKATFKPHLLKDLTDVIIPAILENTKHIPLPRIEYSDPKIDAAVDNLVLESNNFMPDAFEVTSENYLRWGRKKSANKNKHTAEVHIAGLQLDLRNVAYHVKRKQGFPSLTDTGVADIVLPGNGFSAKLKLSSADDKDPQHFFKIDKADVDIKNLKVKLLKSKHKLLFNLFNPIMIRVLHPAIKKLAEKAIRDQFTHYDHLLFQVKQEADRMVEEGKSDPANAPNIYSRYTAALQKRILQGKEEAKAKAKDSPDKKVNYTITKEGSIFPDLELPGENTAKATEFKQLARKGDRWESPVFSIGSAAKSSDLPSPPQVVRKPHAANGGADGSANASNSASRVVNGGSNIASKAVNSVTTNGPDGVRA